MIWSNESISDARNQTRINHDLANECTDTKLTLLFSVGCGREKHPPSTWANRAANRELGKGLQRADPQEWILCRGPNDLSPPRSLLVELGYISL